MIAYFKFLYVICMQKSYYYPASELHYRALLVIQKVYGKEEGHVGINESIPYRVNCFANKDIYPWSYLEVGKTKG